MYFPAIHCSSIEGVLSDHMTYHLLSGTLGEFGSLAMLECSEGYSFGAGHRTLGCLANGTWEGSDDPATCKSKSHKYSNMAKLTQVYAVLGPATVFSLPLNCQFQSTGTDNNDNYRVIQHFHFHHFIDTCKNSHVCQAAEHLAIHLINLSLLLSVSCFFFH